MANTESLGFNYRGKAWNDGSPITRVTQPDGSIAEGMAALGYVWDSSGAQWVKVPGDALNGIKVQITSGTVAVSSEPSDAAVGSALSSVVKVIGGYDPNTGTVKAVRVQNVNGDDQLLVYDGRVRDELAQMNQTLIEIRDLLRGA